MALHRNLGIDDGIHIPYAWEYADSTARTTASGMYSTDEGKFARQLDDDTIWMLIGSSPVTWEPVSAGAVPAHANTHRGDGSDAIDIATTSIAGLMSSDDKTLLNLLALGSIIEVRNESGAQLDKTTAVYVTGIDSEYDIPLVDKADKDDSDKRPAIGILHSNIANNSNGYCLVHGYLTDINTSSWSATDQLVLGSNGALTRPPPDTDPFTGEVQNIASVAVSHVANGSLFINAEGMDTLTANQIFAVSGTYGSPGPSNPFVTSLDPRVASPSHSVEVALSGCDFTSLKDAIDYVYTCNPSDNNIYEIIVYPGDYYEDPFNVGPGVSITAHANRAGTVDIIANNANEDLVTMSGGILIGMGFSGVTDASKAVIRANYPGSLAVMYGVQIENCSTGIAVSNGATCIVDNFSAGINLNNIGTTIDTVVDVSGAGSYFGCIGSYFSVPGALVPFYPVNPIQSVVKTRDGAESYFVGITCRVSAKDTTADAIYADGGSLVTIMASEISQCNRGVRIGSSGDGTTVVIEGCSFRDNTTNTQTDSSTGVIFTNSVADDLVHSGVDGSILSGVLQARDHHRTFLVGLLSYYFDTGETLKLEDWFHDNTSTGISSYEDTAVTISGGLGVTITSGTGWVARHAPYNVSYDVSWDEDTLSVTSGTNYIGYNSTTGLLEASASPPGDATVLLATSVADDSDVKFLHQTRYLEHNIDRRLQEYLLNTRKIMHNSGMVVISGTTNRKFEIDSGNYYRGLDIITYSGTGSDVTFNYYYGTNGATEVASQTQLDNLQYDNSGSLDSMTTNYYKTDTLIVTSEGNASVLYGTSEYSTKELAEEAGVPSIPTFMSDTGITVAQFVIKQGSGIESIIDVRPVASSSFVGAGAGVTAHGDLSGLGNDDHTQYLLTNGNRALSGDLDLGSNSIVNAGNIDGIDVSAHAARHLPGQADALSVGTPVAVQVGASPSDGTANTFSRSDHQHGVSAGSPVSVGTSNSDGSASTVARSDHVHSGLTRGANDFSTFAEKTSLVDADLLLIEDSAVSGAKKKVQISNLPGDTDAIHKSTAAEISTITEKASPVSADLVLIEDSADSNNKKRVQIGNLPASSPTFGSNFQYGESLSSSSTSAVWTQKLRVTTSTLPAGTYRIGWSCELNCSSASADMNIRVQTNDTNTLATGNMEIKDVSSYFPLSGFGYYVVSSPEALNIDLDYGNESSNTTYIRNARLEIWRVE